MIVKLLLISKLRNFNYGKAVNKAILGLFLFLNCRVKYSFPVLVQKKSTGPELFDLIRRRKEIIGNVFRVVRVVLFEKF